LAPQFSGEVSRGQRLEKVVKLSQIPTSQGQLKVLDFRLGAQSLTEKPRPIEWIKFEVEL